ncbi:MAG TPA: DNA-directed RNA polymerase subunit H [Candidatus Korarchaeota archaeon]|nr:DNA-directed RNA polymerase subunit H [Candidatus Korarchaeota archaeon]
MSKKEERSFDLMKHKLVPKHVIASEKEREEVIKKYGPLKYFPKISAKDPIVKEIGAKPGDLIRIERPDSIVPFYRVVEGIPLVVPRTAKEGVEEEFSDVEVEG